MLTTFHVQIITETTEHIDVKMCEDYAEVKRAEPKKDNEEEKRTVHILPFNQALEMDNGQAGLDVDMREHASNKALQLVTSSANAHQFGQSDVEKIREKYIDEETLKDWNNFVLNNKHWFMENCYGSFNGHWEITSLASFFIKKRVEGSLPMIDNQLRKSLYKYKKYLQAVLGMILVKGEMNAKTTAMLQRVQRKIIFLEAYNGALKHDFSELSSSVSSSSDYAIDELSSSMNTLSLKFVHVCVQCFIF